MTLSTSAVAVCCCSASLRSSVRCLHLVEQADVLDGDHRLIGEGGGEFDLSRSERLDALPRQDNDADRLALAQQRNAESGVLAGERDRLAHGVFGIAGDVEDVHGAAVERRAAGDGTSIHGDRVPFKEFEVGIGEADRSARPVHVAFAAQDECHLGVAQMRCGMDQRVKHRLQIEGRAADHLEHVCGGGLLVQRFRQVVGARL